MKTAAELLRQLRTLGVQLSAAGGQLRVSAARGVITEEIRDSIAAAKPELLGELEGTAEGAPLSSFQRRLWFLQRLEPGNTAYNFSTVWVFDGADSARVSGAIAGLVARHPILRSVFREADATPRLYHSLNQTA